MKRQVFLLRVNPEDWVWGNKPHNWDDLEIGADVSFDGNCENHKHIEQIKLHDIFVGYNMDHPDKLQGRNKSMVCVGRIISDRCFESVGTKELPKRFLVQKVLSLKHHLSLTWMKENLNTSELSVYQPTVIKLIEEDWKRIKEKIISDEAKLKEGITFLEDSWTDIQIPKRLYPPHS